MSGKPPRSGWADALTHELGSSLTVAKARAQLIGRSTWPITASRHQRLLEHARSIDEAVNAAVGRLARLTADHARRWPDDVPPSIADADPPSMVNGPLSAALDRVQETRYVAPFRD
jgi:hypothetical protein